jgi:hypothetical protein
VLSGIAEARTGRRWLMKEKSPNQPLVRPFRQHPVPKKPAGNCLFLRAGPIASAWLQSSMRGSRLAMGTGSA